MHGRKTKYRNTIFPQYGAALRGTHHRTSDRTVDLGRGALTFVIFPPLKLANLFSDSVRTLDARWSVKRLVAGTFFLHLGE